MRIRQTRCALVTGFQKCALPISEWPSWTPPAEMRRREAAKGHILPVVQKGGIDNPLGARAMYLYKGGRDTIFRIHGTNQPWTIGHNMRSEEHTSELQSLMRISYAVFCLKKKKIT